MKPLSFERYRFDFFRALDWRWWAAHSLADRPGRLRRADDPAVSALAEFIRAERVDYRRRPEPPEWDQIRAARRLWVDGGLVRAEVEARILAGQTDAEVAGACGLVPETVRWFESAFFCVRDRLTARDWVACRVIGRHFPPDDPAPVWKQFAYAGGAVALDLVVAVTTGRPLPGALTAGRPADREYEDARLRLLVELIVAVLRSTTPAELVGLIDRYRAAQAVDRRRPVGKRALAADLRGPRAALALAARAAGPKSGRTGTGPAAKARDREPAAIRPRPAARVRPGAAAGR